MSLAALALVTVAAILHAGWNALATRGRDPIVFLWWSTLWAAACLAPFALWQLAGSGVPVRALPFVAATVALHALYFCALGRAYASGAYSLVYPVARGLGVALVPVLALVVLDERLSLLGTLGIALVVAGIAALHTVPGAPRAARGAGTAWAVLTGLTIAGYSVVDKAGVRHLSPVAYMTLLEAGCAVALAPAALARRGAVGSEWAANRSRVILVGAMSGTAYMLVQFAFQLGKTGYVVAAREMSIVLSTVIGSVWLGEGRLAPRLAGAGVVLAGVACVALAR